MATIIDKSEGSRASLGFTQRQTIKRREFKAALERGYTKLGEGAYGMVFSRDDEPDTVLKVGTYDRDEFAVDGWLDYVRTLGDHPSPHRLRVHSVELYPDHYVARMERLRGAETPKEQEVLSSCRRFRQPSCHNGTLGEFGAVIEECQPDGTLIDCHSGNIMFRMDGTPVITDPYCS